MKTFVALLMLWTVAPGLAQTTREEAPAPPVRPESQPQDVPLGQLRPTGTVHVGESAPDFTTVSTSGRELTLSRLKGDWLVLVFAENREDFGVLRDVEKKLADIGARMYGICKDKPQRLRAYVESERLPFELLADATGEISSLYGYYNWERRSTTRGFVVLNRQGVVRLALQGQAPPQQVSELARFTIVGY